MAQTNMQAAPKKGETNFTVVDVDDVATEKVKLKKGVQIVFDNFCFYTRSQITSIL